MKLKSSVQTWLNNSLMDPIVNILARNSHLTRIQLETLLIDILSENISGKQLKYDDKARLRLTKAQISRGAFNRTLKQAKTNVIKAIYTVLLLGYLGILEGTTLDHYLEVANKLHGYLEAYKETPRAKTEPNEYLKSMEALRKSLEESLKRLSSTSETMT